MDKLSFGQPFKVEDCYRESGILLGQPPRQGTPMGTYPTRGAPSHRLRLRLALTEPRHPLFDVRGQPRESVRLSRWLSHLNVSM